MMNRDAAAVAAKVDPSDFYKPVHGLIAEAIGTLVADEAPVDTGTVAALLRARGQLDGVWSDEFRGGSYLIHLMAVCPLYSSAPVYADWVQRYARQRRMLSLAGALVDAVYTGAGTEGLVAEMVSASEAGMVGVESSWDLVNLATTLAGEDGDDHPTFLNRTDGVSLIYPGRVHAFNAESETGKSMLAIYCCAERIDHGEHVGYIDFEDSARGVIDRLLGFGVTPSQVMEFFHYVRPEDPIDGGARLRVKEMLRVFTMTVVVIDGVAEALALSGWKENEASDITTFYNMLPRAIAREGPAVILIDHLVKDKEKQGNDARGSGAKRAGIDGASFKLEMVIPFTRGGEGYAKVTLTKDRPAWVRPYSVGKVIADMHLSSDAATGAITCELRPPTPPTGPDGQFRPTGIMDRASSVIAGAPGPVAKTWVCDRLNARKAHTLSAIDCLIKEGYVKLVEGSLVHVRTFGDPGPEYEEEY